MTKIMTRLEQLGEFERKGAYLTATIRETERQMQELDKEFQTWMEIELGAKGQLHLSSVLKLTLETSIEPTKTT